MSMPDELRLKCGLFWPAGLRLLFQLRVVSFWEEAQVQAGAKKNQVEQKVFTETGKEQNGVSVGG